MDIDLVYTWVDGDDPDFRRVREQYVDPSIAGADLRELRWQSQNELRYSMRSVARFAPWIRTIHLLTNGQCPSWLNLDHPKIRLVTHEQIYAWPEHLPTFNSTSIETHLHRIPDLSEHFIYANDDMFLGAPAAPGDFFTSLGVILAHPGREMTEQVLKFLAPRQAVYAGMLNALKLLSSEYPDGMLCWPDHQMKPYTRLLFRLAESNWPQAFETTSANRFRCNADVALNYALLTNLAVLARLGVRYHRTDVYVKMGCEEHYRKVLDERPKLFCIHDEDGNSTGLETFLSQLYPQSCEFEK